MRPTLSRATVTFLLVALLFLWTSSAVFADRSTPNPPHFVKRYIETVVAGDWSLAESFWVPHVLSASRRLGIRYTGVPAKYDCASPVIDMREQIRSGTVSVNIAPARPHSNGLEIPVTLQTPGETITVPYFVIEYAGEWRLTTRLDLATRQWQSRTTRYAVVHFRDSTLVNDCALETIDRLVESIATVLGIPDEKLRTLAERKLDHYLGTAKEVELLTGFRTPGMTDLCADAIITEHLPHQHELVHALVNYALGELPLYTVPCLQEGLAVAVGGRWGKSPEVILQLGAFVVENGLTSVADILSYDAFYNSGLPSDLTYAASGLLVRTLLDEFGAQRVLSLYRDLSGSASRVQELSTDSIVTVFEQHLGHSWSEIENLCLSTATRNRYSGVFPSDYSSPSDLDELTSQNGITVSTATSDSITIFNIAFNSDNAAGAVLLTPESSEIDSFYTSRLFHEQMPNRKYTGESYGIVFDEVEVGIYDYRTDVLLGKFAAGFSTTGETITNPDDNIIRFSISRLLFPDVLLSGKTQVVLR